MDGQATRFGRRRRSFIRSILAAIAAGVASIPVVGADHCCAQSGSTQLRQADATNLPRHDAAAELDSANHNVKGFRGFLNDGWTGDQQQSATAPTMPGSGVTRRNHFMDIPAVARDPQSLRDIVSPRQTSKITLSEHDPVANIPEAHVVQENPLAVEQDASPSLRRFQIDSSRELRPLSEFVADDETIREALEVTTESSESKATDKAASTLAEVFAEQDALRRAAVKDGFSLVGSERKDSKEHCEERYSEEPDDPSNESPVHDELAVLLRDGSTLAVQQNEPSEQTDVAVSQSARMNATPLPALPLPDLPSPESRVIEPKRNKTTTAHDVAENIKQPIVPSRPRDEISSPMRLSTLKLSQKVRRLMPPATASMNQENPQTKTPPAEPKQNTKTKTSPWSRWNPFRSRS